MKIDQRQIDLFIYETRGIQNQCFGQNPSLTQDACFSIPFEPYVFDLFITSLSSIVWEIIPEGI